MTPLPLFFPTRVVLIDDEPQVLRMTALLFERRPEVAEVVVFTRAADAISFLERSAERSPELDVFAGARVHDEIEDGGAAEVPLVCRTVEIRLSELARVLRMPERHALNSVIVCDYAMPGMDGLEFFGRLRDAAVRRVLLTALCDEQRAVQAFNRGLIHQFVHKADPAGPRGLEQVLLTQIREFFLLRTAHLRAALALGRAGQFLRHSGVTSLLERVMRESGFREYSFSVTPSGFRLRSPGDDTLLTLADADDFDRCARVVREIEGPRELADALAERRVMPVARDATPIYEAGNDWRERVLEPRLDAVHQPLYWALLTPGGSI
jgi:CheY-like chemotaxis protein